MTSCTYSTLQHTATHCNTLQYTATHCNTLQHAATHCNTLYRTLQHTVTRHHTHIPAPYLVCRVSTYACYLYISIEIYVIFGLFLFTFSNLIFGIPRMAKLLHGLSEIWILCTCIWHNCKYAFRHPTLYLSQPQNMDVICVYFP